MRPSARDLARDLDRACDHVGALACDLDRACDHARARGLAHGRRALIRARAQARVLDLARELDRADDLAHDLTRVLDLARDLDAARDLAYHLVKVLGQAAELARGRTAGDRGQRGPGRVAPWAGRLLAAAARLLPAADRARYGEEYRSELWEIAHARQSRRRQAALLARLGLPALAGMVVLGILLLAVICWVISNGDRSDRAARLMLALRDKASCLAPGAAVPAVPARRSRR